MEYKPVLQKRSEPTPGKKSKRQVSTSIDLENMEDLALVMTRHLIQKSDEVLESHWNRLVNRLEKALPFLYCCSAHPIYLRVF